MPPSGRMFPGDGVNGPNAAAEDAAQGPEAAAEGSKSAMNGPLQRHGGCSRLRAAATALLRKAACGILVLVQLGIREKPHFQVKAGHPWQPFVAWVATMAARHRYYARGSIRPQQALLLRAPAGVRRHPATASSGGSARSPLPARAGRWDVARNRHRHAPSPHLLPVGGSH